MNWDVGSVYVGALHFDLPHEHALLQPCYHWVIVKEFRIYAMKIGYVFARILNVKRLQGGEASKVISGRLSLPEDKGFGFHSLSIAF